MSENNTRKFIKIENNVWYIYSIDRFLVRSTDEVNKDFKWMFFAKYEKNIPKHFCFQVSKVDHVHSMIGILEEEDSLPIIEDARKENVV